MKRINIQHSYLENFLKYFKCEIFHFSHNFSWINAVDRASFGPDFLRNVVEQPESSKYPPNHKAQKNSKLRQLASEVYCRTTFRILFTPWHQNFLRRRIGDCVGAIWTWFSDSHWCAGRVMLFLNLFYNQRFSSLISSGSKGKSSTSISRSKAGFYLRTKDSRDKFRAY